MTVAVDWLAIRNDYISGGGSYRKLAEKYGVKFSTLKDRAVSEKWKEAKTEQTNKTRTKTEQKTAEKIADALSDEAAAKVRIRAKLVTLAENWVDSQDGAISDTSDFRRMVQSCMDLGVLNIPESPNEKDDGFLDALRGEAADVWQED